MEGGRVREDLARIAKRMINPTAKVIMEEVEISYQVPAMETRTQTVQRPKTVM